MREKKNCSSGDTLEQQMKLSGFASSERDYSTADGKISSILLPGQRNSIALKTLEQWTGLDGRTIRRMIEDERRQFIPIVADNHTGYFLAETELEKDLCVRSMRNRSREIAITADCIDQANVIGE